jgi:hypothetical protein
MGVCSSVHRIAAIPTDRRTRRRMSARFCTSTTTAACRETTRSSADRVTGRKSIRPDTELQGGDEVNVIVAGGNYGWPLVSYGRDHDGTAAAPRPWREDLIAPALYWVPSIAASSIALLQRGGDTGLGR